VTLAQPPDQSIAERHRIQGIFFVVASDPDELRRIADLAEQGELRPVIARRLPLADASIAYGPPLATRKDRLSGPAMTSRAPPDRSTARICRRPRLRLRAV
jgi:hypothetical protein